MSRRGAQGGYTLAIPPSQLSVGDIIRFVEGPISPVKCIVGGEETGCALRDNCQRAKDALEQVYNSTSFQDLVEAAQVQTSTKNPNYSI